MRFGLGKIIDRFVHVKPWSMAKQNFVRHSTLTIATVSLIALMVFIFNVVFSIRVLTDEIFGFLNSKVDISLEFSPTADEVAQSEFIQNISTQPFIRSVQLVSQEDALDTVDAELIPGYRAFLERNNLSNPFPSSLNIVTKSVSDHQAVFDYVLSTDQLSLFTESTRSTLQGIRKSESGVIQGSASQELLGFSGLINTILFLTLFIFALASIAILVNAVYLSIKAKKKELQVMHLVGASEKFILLPYTYEGVLYGFTSALLGQILFFALVIFGGWELLPLLFSPARVLLELVVVTGISASVSLMVVRQFLRGNLKL
jgi:cell division transport system permease protein